MAMHHRAIPEAGTGPGALVLHAWWGFTPFFQGFCGRLAQEGFVVVAPDLYHGATATTIAEAEKLRSKVKRDAAAQEIVEAAEDLRRDCGGQPIGAVGFSLGGYWALWLAEQEASPLAATAVFYGSRGGEYTAGCPAFQFHLAETDPYVAASGVKKLQRALKAAGKEAEFHTYPGTGHWFFESDRAAAYDPQAADLAWRRVVQFLRRHLAR